MSETQPSCEIVWRALSERPAGDAGEAWPEWVADHLGGCDACRDAWDAERAQVAAFRAATVPRTVPAFERVAGALDERQRGQRRRAARLAWGLGVAAMAGAVAAMVLMTPAPVGLPTDGVGIVDRAGLVSWARDGAWETMSDGVTTLVGGDVLETGSDGAVTLSRPEVAEVEVGPGTRVALTSWTDDVVEMRLERGALTSTVEHRAAGQRFEIVTPEARVVVVGTRFVTHHEDGRGTTVEGMSGVVRVFRKDGSVAGEVRAGERLQVPETQVAAGSAELRRLAAGAEAQANAGAEAQANAGAEAQANAEAEAQASAEANAGAEAQANAGAERRGSGRDDRRPQANAGAEAQANAGTERRGSGRDDRGPQANEGAERRGSGRDDRGPQANAGAERRGSGRDDRGPQASERGPEVGGAPAEGGRNDRGPHANDGGPAGHAETEARAAPVPTLGEARAALAAGRTDAAVAALERHVGAAPTLEAWTLLGDAHLVAGRQREAAAAYDHAVRLAGTRDPGGLVIDLGEVELALGRTTAARERWGDYLERFPNGATAPRVASRLARLLAEAGDDGDAEQLWRMVLARIPRAPEGATALAELGRRLLARRAWDAAAALFEPHADPPRGRLGETALAGLVHARAGQGRREAVIALAERYRRAFPDGRRAAEVRALAEAAAAP